ncbi:NAD(P)/FAD-dependent oxidoreductase [Neogemmobacter tilapiae]|uniref:Flavoprotein n=1 Tax=Neogemmobacter tilapiae TaxID=875041 RepID=A0A918TCT2_9RHOB|nr:NAD(P)/FAD-dependent oxidoreductase [Gemmobacter tilapiae]GHC43584.1 flavoprotein [Gemmobacter tilapiae]
MESYDVIVLGAGAAGLFAGATAARRGRRVLVIDHAANPGEKIRISGGGRCNFTNLNTRPDRFLSENPRFAASALAGFTPRDFLAKVERAGIAYHEKTLGQLFCDGSARQIVDLLLRDLREAGGDLRLSTSVESVDRVGEGFKVLTGAGLLQAGSVIVATGGKSIPKMGATGFGYRLAEQFGLRLVETRPGLVPLTFGPDQLEHLAPLSGLSVSGRVSVGKTRFDEALLFTHRGLSGPAILQISSYWREGEEILLDLAPERPVGAELREARQKQGRVALRTVLGAFLPERLARLMEGLSGLQGNLADQNNAKLDQLAGLIHGWRLKPTGSEGYRTAEVTLGGVSTADLDAKTLQARAVPGLFFVGEVVDVTGWLGGYNFQWAWASGFAAGQVA